MAEKLYAERDFDELGDDYVRHYMRHLNAMTAEGLHLKSHIAAELAWRDVEATELRRMLFAAHCQFRHRAYADDEQMHCAACKIDWAKMTTREIREQLYTNMIAALSAQGKEQK